MLNQLPQVITLPNNFKIISLKYKGINSVALNLRVKAGSNYETQSQIGAAHFLEHMLLMGTKQYPTPKQLKELIINMGGKIISSTSREDVFYYIKLLSNDFSAGFEFLSQVIKCPLITSEHLNIQKEIIEQEIKRSYNNPEKYILRLNYKLLFPNTRLALLNTGSLEDINTMSVTSLENFFKSNYHASNVCLGMCGNISNKVLKSAEKYFSNYA